MALLIGTSGWQYRDWRPGFYPEGLAQGRWLEHYAQRFATVELNSTFYRLPSQQTFATWRQRTPEDFVFAMKASRYLTHIRWAAPAEPVARLLEAATGLGHKLGPVLLQLRDTVRADSAALDEVLSRFPQGVKVAFEPRHPSWFTDRTLAVLASHDAALCLADTPRRKEPWWPSASWGYVRFHQGRAHPSPCYGRTALARSAERLAELWPAGAQVYAYFNNDTFGCAVRDARVLALAARRCGLHPTRVPSAREVPVPAEVAG